MTMTKQSNTAKLQDHYLHFERQLRQAKSINELGFIACNNSKIFLSFNQVMLWKADNNKAVIQTISGVANLDRNSPMLQWMRQVVEVLMKQTETVFAVDRTSLPKSLNDKWQDWLPPYIICAKLLGPDDSLQGILIVSNEQNFSQSQQQVITLVSEVIGYSMFALRPKRIRFLKRLKNRSTAIGLAITIVVAGILMLPVTQTVLAPAEVTAKNSDIITAPLNGVINKFFVTPNEKVVAGQKLYQFDTTELNNHMKIAQKSYLAAIEKYRKASQYTFKNAAGSTELSLLKIAIMKAKDDLDYTRQLLRRTLVTSPINGIAIFADADDWLGKPVQVGEKVLAIANPAQQQLDVWLPVDHAIEFPKAAAVKLYLNASPLHAIKAHLSYASYGATERSDGTIAYHLRAQFDSDESVSRIGLRGTAKLYGEQVSLAYYLFHKPISALRQTLGV